jgi:hypothetical protein
MGAAIAAVDEVLVWSALPADRSLVRCQTIAPSNCADDGLFLAYLLGFCAASTICSTAPHAALRLERKRGTHRVYSVRRILILLVDCYSDGNAAGKRCAEFVPWPVMAETQNQDGRTT